MKEIKLDGVTHAVLWERKGELEITQKAPFSQHGVEKVFLTKEDLETLLRFVTENGEGEQLDGQFHDDAPKRD